MMYKPLGEKTLIEYIQGRQSLVGVLNTHNDLRVKEIGDGNLNLVFIVEEADNPEHSVIVKQALPYLRVVGESWPLTRERVRFEAEALQKHHELAPGRVPFVYDFDEDMSLVIMEHLKRYEVMRIPLVNRVRFPLFVDHISTFLANTLFFTSDLYLTGPEKKELQRRFINPDLCKIQEDFVFTNPFMRSDENQWNRLLDAEVASIRQNGMLKQAIMELKADFLTNAQALLHSDLHTGSIMLNQTDTRVIDPEFAFFGPMGFDIGAILGNLVLNYASHFAHTPDRTERQLYQEYLLNTIHGVWVEFAAKFDALWTANNRGDLAPARFWEYPGGLEDFAEFRKEYVHKVWRDTLGYAGCKMLRRMMGVVSVWDITSIVDCEKRAVAERLAIRIGQRFVMERDSLLNVNEIIELVQAESGQIAQ